MPLKESNRMARAGANIANIGTTWDIGYSFWSSKNANVVFYVNNSYFIVSRIEVKVCFCCCCCIQHTTLCVPAKWKVLQSFEFRPRRKCLNAYDARAFVTDFVKIGIVVGNARASSRIHVGDKTKGFPSKDPAEEEVFLFVCDKKNSGDDAQRRRFRVEE